jgi:uncharacterized protein YukE
MSDWSLVNGDPAPGNVEQIKRSASDLSRAAGFLRDASSELSRISRGSSDADWRGAAADAFRDVLQSFQYELHPIANSFDKVSSVMTVYGRQVEGLQAEARQALRRAQLAKAAEDQNAGAKDAAMAVLRRQQSSVLSNQANEARHKAGSVVGGIVDPSAAAARQAEQARLAGETQRARAAAAATQAKVAQLDSAIASARADLASARSTTRTIHEEWDRYSRATASVVDDSLDAHLKNRSNLEKFLGKLSDTLEAVERFIDDPLPYLADLYKVIGEIEKVISTLTTVISLLAKIAAVIPGLQHVAAGLAAVAAVLGVVALVLAATKLVLGAILWGNNFPGPDGKPMIGTGDLALSAFDVGSSLIGGGAFDKAKGAMAEVRRSQKIIKNTGSFIYPVSDSPAIRKYLWHKARTDLRGIAFDEAKKYGKKRFDGYIDDHFGPAPDTIVRDGIRRTLNNLDDGRVRVEIPIPRTKHVLEVGVD